MARPLQAWSERRDLLRVLPIQPDPTARRLAAEIGRALQLLGVASVRELIPAHVRLP